MSLMPASRAVTAPVNCLDGVRTTGLALVFAAAGTAAPRLAGFALIFPLAGALAAGRAAGFALDTFGAGFAFTGFCGGFAFFTAGFLGFFGRGFDFFAIVRCATYSVLS